MNVRSRALVSVLIFAAAPAMAWIEHEPHKCAVTRPATDDEANLLGRSTFLYLAQTSAGANAAQSSHALDQTLRTLRSRCVRLRADVRSARDVGEFARGSSAIAVELKESPPASAMIKPAIVATCMTVGYVVLKAWALCPPGAIPINPFQ